VNWLSQPQRFSSFFVKIARQFQQLNLGSLELTPTVNGNAVVAANLAVAKLGITLEQVRFTGASTLTSPRGAGT